MPVNTKVPQACKWISGFALRAGGAMLVAAAFCLPGLLAIAYAEDSPTTLGATETADGGEVWWEMYPLPATGPMEFIETIGADTVVPAVHVDIGMGMTHLDAELDGKLTRARHLEAAGCKWVCYAEASGTFGAYAARIEDIEREGRDFTAVTDNHWTNSWDRLDPARPGRIVLSGMPAFVIESPWLLKLAGSRGRTYARSRSDFALEPIRFAPDTATPGKVATTWREVVEAGASKASDGRAYCTYISLGSSLQGNDALTAALELPEVSLAGGQAQRGTMMDWGKDILNPFWETYDRRIVRLYVEELGAWGVHYDNFSGFDFLSWRPGTMGFGDWSVYYFRRYLKEHEIVADPESFDVRKYVATKYPRNDPRWLDDPVWRSFLVFKRDALRRYFKSLADNVRTLEKETGRDLVIMGNDLPFADSNGAVLPGMLDVSSSETNPYDRFPYTRYGVGLPPRGRMAVSYLLQSAKTSSDFVFPWYYLHAEDVGKPNLEKVLLFEGLAHQAMLVAAPKGFHGTPRPSDVDVLRSFNCFVRTVRPFWYGRKAVSNVGLLFSGDSQMADQLPWHFHDHLHVNEFYGWGQFLVEEHVQWRAVLAESLDEFLSSGADLLIVPHAVCLSTATVHGIAQWVADGGRVIFTGQSGSRSEADGFLARQSSPVLSLAGVEAADEDAFVVRKVGTGTVVYVGATPGAEYLRDPADPRAAGRELLLAAFQGAGGRSLPHSAILSSNAEGNLGIRVHESVKNESFFVDLFNYNIQANDALAPYNDVVIKLRLPKYLSDRKLVVWSIASGVVTVGSRLLHSSSYTVSDGVLDLHVGTVEYYNAIMLRPAAVGPVILVTQPKWERASTVATADTPVAVTWIASEKEKLFGYSLSGPGPQEVAMEGRTAELRLETPPLPDGTYTFRVWPARLPPARGASRTFIVDTEGPELDIISGPEEGQAVAVVAPGLFNAYFVWQGRDPSGIKHYQIRVRPIDGPRPPWSETSSDRAGFRLTEPGEYRFELRAFDRHDHLSDRIHRTFAVVVAAEKGDSVPPEADNAE